MCLQQEIPLTSSSHFVFPPSLYSITLVYRLNGFTELTEAKYVQIWDILNKFYWTIPWISCSILANTPKQSNSKVHTKKHSLRSYNRHLCYLNTEKISNID